MRVKDTDLADSRKRSFLTKIRKAHSDRRGFTLTELLLVVTIMLILGALGFSAAISYHRHLKRLEMDETAQEIYVIAQNHLAQEDENGQLHQKLLADRSSGIEDPFWQSKAASLTDMQKVSKVGDLCYIQHESGQDFHNDKQTTILDYMLPFGAVDETVSVGGQYIIAYDRDTLQVYEVFYTDAPKGKFTLKWDSLDDSYRTKAKKRERYDGKTGNIIGYYGGDGISFENLSLDQVSLDVENGNRLTALIHYPLDPEELKKSKENASLSLNLVVRGMSSNAVSTIKTGTLEYSKSGTAAVKADSSLQPGFQAKAAGPFAIRNKQIYEIGLVLDDITNPGSHFSELFPADDQDKNNSFIPGEDIEVYATVTQDGAPVSGQESNHIITNSLFAQVATDDDPDNKEADTAAVAGISNFRHLENLDRSISALNTDASHDVVYAREDGNITGRTIGGKKDTSFDADQSLKKDAAVQDFYHITKAKQLSQLCWVSDEEASEGSEASEGNPAAAVSMPDPFCDPDADPLTIDSKTSKFTDTTSGIIYLNQKSGLTPTEQTAGYIGIDNPALTEYDGDSLTIYNLQGKSLNLLGDHFNSSNNAGLFRLVESPMRLSNIRLIRSSFRADGRIGEGKDAGNAGSLAAESKAQLIIRNCFVAGTVSTNKGQYAGGLVGVSANEIHIQNSGIYAEPVKKDYKSSYYASYTETDQPEIGKDYVPAVYSSGQNAKAGGLIGYVRVHKGTTFDTAREVSIDNSFASVSVGSAYEGIKDNECAGGLIGAVNNDDTEISLTITNSYAGGMTSQQDPSKYSEAFPNVAAPYAGGVVGYFYKGSVSCNIVNTYSTAAVSDVSGIPENDESAIGGFFGYLTYDAHTRVNLAGVYTTGAVYAESDGKNAMAGAFIGSCDPDKNPVLVMQNTFAGNLEGVNKDLPAIGNLDESDDQFEDINDSFTLKETDLTDGPDAANVSAAPYSRREAGYPYCSWTTADPAHQRTGVLHKIHYGDWPAPQPESPDELYLAYRDKHTDDASYGYYAIDEKTFDLYDGTEGHSLEGIEGLKYSPAFIKNEDAEYGILTTEDDPAKLKLESGRDLLSSIDTDSDDYAVTSKYYFYPLSRAISIDQTVVPNYGMKSLTFEDGHTLYYNDAFARALSDDYRTFYSDRSSYLVRTARQFYNMNHYSDRSFVQAANLNMAYLPGDQLFRDSGNLPVNGHAVVFYDNLQGTVYYDADDQDTLKNYYFLPEYKGDSVIASAAFSGTYNGFFDDSGKLSKGHQYRIDNLEITGYTTYEVKNYYAGLFAKNTGSLKNIDLSGKISLKKKALSGTDNISCIGTAAAVNDGTMDHVISSASVYSDLTDLSYRDQNYYYVGGLIGYAYLDGQSAYIKDSKYCVSEDELDYSIDPDFNPNDAADDSTFYCGGLIGCAQGNGQIENSYVHAAINNQQTAAAYYYGGMVGAAFDALEIHDSYASVAFQNDGAFTIVDSSYSMDLYHTGLWVGYDGSGKYGNNYAVERRLGPSNRVIPSTHRLEAVTAVTKGSSQDDTIGNYLYEMFGSSGQNRPDDEWTAAQPIAGVYTYIDPIVAIRTEEGGTISLGNSGDQVSTSNYKLTIYDDEIEQIPITGIRSVFYAEDQLNQNWSAVQMIGHADVNHIDYLPTFAWDGGHAPLDLLSGNVLPAELVYDGEYWPNQEKLTEAFEEIYGREPSDFNDLSNNINFYMLSSGIFMDNGSMYLVTSRGPNQGRMTGSEALNALHGGGKVGTGNVIIKIEDTTIHVEPRDPAAYPLYIKAGDIYRFGNKLYVCTEEFTFYGYDNDYPGKNSHWDLLVTNLPGFKITGNNGKEVIVNNFNAKTPTLIYDSNGGEGTMDPVTGKVYQYIRLSQSDFTRTGYDFVGWNSRRDGSGTPYQAGDRFEFMTKTKVILYAQWEAKPVTITYLDGSDAETAKSFTDQDHKFGDRVTAPSAEEVGFKRDGYSLTAWNTAADGSGQTIKTGESFQISSESVTLYAQWADASKYLTATADDNTITFTYNGYAYTASITAAPADNIFRSHTLYRYENKLFYINQNYDADASYNTLDVMDSWNTDVVQIGNTVYTDKYFNQDYPIPVSKGDMHITSGGRIFACDKDWKINAYSDLSGYPWVEITSIFEKAETVKGEFTP